jgi:quercetin dioxygenase-like cupin family protein
MNDTDRIVTGPSFLTSPAVPGQVFDFRSDRLPTVVSSWNDSTLKLDTEGSHFGFVGRGHATLSCVSGTFTLREGMYFAANSAATIEGNGHGFVASRIDERGVFQIGGPIEQTGRLRYIDGCSDSLLIAPPLRGDPCLNLLHIPPHTDQTAHTHPSLRVGMVVDGQALCRTPQGDVPMAAGQIFVIRAEGVHGFHTQASSARIVAWHPDSDFGPTDDDHPMLNKTLVDGLSLNPMRARR